MAFVNCTYTGVQQVRRFHLTVGHGGVCIAILDIVPQLFLPAVDGELFLTDGNRTLLVPGCRLDRASMVFSESGFICRITVLGPTWKWYRAGIDGVYNIVRADGRIQSGTERTPQELATLLFQAMKVPIFDVSGLPNTTRPFVGWRGAMALDELRNLCHSLGCDLVLDLQGTRAEIWQLGFGANLPDVDAITMDFGLDLSEPPDSIKVYCGPTIFQSKLKLEAVMPDKDGTIKRIEDVSYAPDGGWDGVDPFDPLPASTDAVAKALAKKYLYRMWRVVSQADDTQNVPGHGDVGGVEDILPLYDKLVDSYDDAGVFEQDGYLEGTIAIDSEPQPYENTEPHERIDINYSLDKERGIIMASTPLTKLNDLDQWTKADVFFVCSYHVRDKDTYGDVYHSLEVQIANNHTGFLPVHRPELVRQVVAQYNDATVTGTQDNQSDLTVQLQAQAEATLAEFQATGAVVKRYRGLVPIRLDGAIRQVTYMGRCDGRKGFYTVASRNTEFECGVDTRIQRGRKMYAERSKIMRDLHDYENYRAMKQGAIKR